MPTASPTPSHADLSSLPSEDEPPIERAWAEAVARERLWYGVQTGALGFLLLAVLTWQRTPPNVALEAALCVLVAIASSRHSQSGRTRARLSPVRADRGSDPAPKAVEPLVKAPRA